MTLPVVLAERLAATVRMAAPPGVPMLAFPEPLVSTPATKPLSARLTVVAVMAPELSMMPPRLDLPAVLPSEEVRLIVPMVPEAGAMEPLIVICPLPLAASGVVEMEKELEALPPALELRMETEPVF